MRWLVRIWPISRFAAWLEWRRRDREETLVATCTYKTDYVDTKRQVEHHVRFLIDGNGVRYCRLHTGPNSIDKRAASVQPAYRRDKFHWETHGDIPDYARRTDNRPRGKLIAFDGGAA